MIPPDRYFGDSVKKISTNSAEKLQISDYQQENNTPDPQFGIWLTHKAAPPFISSIMKVSDAFPNQNSPNFSRR